MKLDPQYNIGTSGGEGEFCNEYSIDYSDGDYDRSIEMSPEQYKHLGLCIINHLMTNGHRFKIGNDYNGDYLQPL